LCWRHLVGVDEAAVGLDKLGVGGVEWSAVCGLAGAGRTGEVRSTVSPTVDGRPYRLVYLKARRVRERLAVGSGDAFPDRVALA
jgi:hypothetical protein